MCEVSSSLCHNLIITFFPPRSTFVSAGGRMTSQFLRVRAEHLSACYTFAVAQNQLSAFSRTRSRTSRVNLTNDEAVQWHQALCQANFPVWISKRQRSAMWRPPSKHWTRERSPICHRQEFRK